MVDHNSDDLIRAKQGELWRHFNSLMLLLLSAFRSMSSDTFATYWMNVPVIVDSITGL